MHVKARLHLTLAGVLSLTLSGRTQSRHCHCGQRQQLTDGGLYLIPYFLQGQLHHRSTPRGTPGVVVPLTGSENGWAGGGPDDGLGTVYELHRVDGAAFSLVSFQAANLDDTTPGHVLPVADNPAFQNDEAFVPMTSSLTTFSLAGFTDVTAIYFSVINFSSDSSNLVADNFVLGAAVPEPSTFSSGGLGALIVAGWVLLRRKSGATAC